jgi:Tol biopolymer transport system component
VDAQNLIYFTPAATAGEPGRIWEIPAILEGPPHRPLTAVNGGDISPDGAKLAAFRLNDGRVELQVVDRESGRTLSARPMPPDRTLGAIRWSPDGEWLAYQRTETAFADRLYVVGPDSGQETEVARASSIQGFDWLPGDGGLIYASSEGSTVLYPPIYTLRTVRRDGTANRQLTLSDDSYTQPDVDPRSGNLVASRIRMQSNIYRFPAEQDAVSNTEKRFAVTRQTGLAQTPSMSPDGTEIAFLSDSGGHGNVWIAKTDGSGARQLTTERDPDISIGVPIWSTVGNHIAFIVASAARTDIDLIAADGSGRRRVVTSGIGAIWSADGKWLYYTSRTDKYCIERIPMPLGGKPEPVRCDGAIAAAISDDNSTLYFFRYLQRAYGEVGTEILKATPPNGKEQKLASVVGARVPVNVGMLTGVLSKDNSRFALPLTDGQTSNIWVMSTDDGSMSKLTDFGDRAVMMARRVAWSPDDRFVFAAVGDMDGDIMLIRPLAR